MDISGQGQNGLVVIANSHLVGDKLVETGLRFLVNVDIPVLADEPVDLVHGDEQIRNHHGIVPEPVKARLPGLARQVLAQSNDRCRRNRGAVLPQRRQQVRHGGDGHSPVEGRLETVDGRHRLAQAVHGDDRVLEPAQGQPFRNGHLLGHPHLMQLDSRPGQLFHRLDEIPRVRPQAGVVQGDAEIPRLAGETRHPLDLFPAPGRILAGVRIASREDDGVPAIFPHQGADGVHALGKDVFHGTIIDYFHKYKYICRY